MNHFCLKNYLSNLFKIRKISLKIHKITSKIRSYNQLHLLFWQVFHGGRRSCWQQYVKTLDSPFSTLQFLFGLTLHLSIDSMLHGDNLTRALRYTTSNSDATGSYNRNWPSPGDQPSQLNEGRHHRAQSAT